MSTFERATVGLFLWWSANAALGSDPRWFGAVSRFGVAETAARIEEVARRRGLSVQRIDHGAEANAAGLRLPPTQSLWVEQGDAAARLVVWQAPDGVTRVATRDARALELARPAVDAPDRAVRRPQDSTTHPHVFGPSH